KTWCFSTCGRGENSVTFSSARGRLLIRAALCFLLVLTFGASARATIQSTVLLAHPERHLFHVTMAIPDVTGEVTVRMAAWNALYQIRDFSSHLQQVEAMAGSQKVFVEKLDKQTWRVKGSGTIKISYATYWDEVGPFASQLNSEHAFINPAMILMYVPERRSESVSLSVVLSSRSEEHTSELQSRSDLVCRLLLEKKKNNENNTNLI